MAETAGAAAGDWRKLSAWSMVHFAARAVIQNVQALAFSGAGAYGVSQSEFDEFTWALPIGVIALVVTASVLTYLFYRFRVTEDSIQARSGVLFKKHLNLSFERIQNINLEHPFYFRPLGLVTLRIDGAGAAGEEVSLAALGRGEAEAIRTYIVGKRQELGGSGDGSESAPEDAAAEVEQAFFTRSLVDLVIHGLTNNRAFLAIAGLVAVLSQANTAVERLMEALVARIDIIVGDFSLVRLAVLFVAAFIVVTGALALLSVLVSIVQYFGFTIYRTNSGLTVKRGLMTRHEINIRKSRIQTVAFRQDWIDFLIGRRNIVFEQISHAAPGHEHNANARKRILVPSARLDETGALIDEVLPGCRVDELAFTPIRKRYFYKHAVIRSAFHGLALAVPLLVPGMFSFYVPLVLLLWPPHMAYVYLKWKRAGIAVDGNLIAARSGAVGIDYHVFPAFKAQNVSHVQSVLMRRHDLSTLVFHTAASTITVPYLSTDFAKRVVDYCLYRVETSDKSWM